MSALYDKLLREAAQQRTLPKRRPPNGGLPSRAPDRASNRPVHPACAQLNPLERAEREADAILVARKAAPIKAVQGVADATARLRGFELSRLARIIRADWGGSVNYAAEPYLRALANLRVVDPRGASYGADDAAMIVAYFLSNARTWRGPVAKAVKAELNRRIK